MNPNIVELNTMNRVHIDHIKNEHVREMLFNYDANLTRYINAENAFVDNLLNLQLQTEEFQKLKNEESALLKKYLIYKEDAASYMEQSTQRSAQLTDIIKQINLLILRINRIGKDIKEIERILVQRQRQITMADLKNTHTQLVSLRPSIIQMFAPPTRV